MQDFESQIAKIALGNFKSTKSFVHVMAEKAPNGETELYLAAELPILNPAALESCKQICDAIESTLKRSFRNRTSQNQFENTISSINEELSKLAATGETHWINKLNCAVGVLENGKLDLATCGKVATYLLRNGSFTDISCSSPSTNPIKAFDTFSSGKLKLDDIIILSTTQLFNYISIDRLKDILSSNDFLNASRSVVEILKSGAGPEVAFGTIINWLALPGTAPEEDTDLENYLSPAQALSESKTVKLLKFFKAIIPTRSSPRRIPEISPSYKKTNWLNLQTLKNIINYVKNIPNKTRILAQKIASLFRLAQNFFSIERFKNLTPQKKFFTASVFILIIAFAVNLWIALLYKQNKTEISRINESLNQAQKLLSDARTSLVYNNQKDAVDFLILAKQKLSEVKPGKIDNQLYEKTKDEILNLENKIDKKIEAKITSLGDLAYGESLITLPGFLAVQSGNQIVSFNKKTEKIEDNALKSPENIISSYGISDTESTIYNGSNLRVLNPITGKISEAAAENVPIKDNFVGIKYYPVNNRIYVLDKEKLQAISFLVSGEKLQKPILSLKNIPEISKTQDFAIDGSIYLLTRNAIVKYQAGKLAEFNLPYLITPFDGQGKIYTETTFKYIYLLDKTQKRIIILDKKGSLLGVIKNEQISKPVDFAVDEKNKTIFLLNNSTLLKINY